MAEYCLACTFLWFNPRLSLKVSVLILNWTQVQETDIEAELLEKVPLAFSQSCLLETADVQKLPLLLVLLFLIAHDIASVSCCACRM